MIWLPQELIGLIGPFRKLAVNERKYMKIKKMYEHYGNIWKLCEFMKILFNILLYFTIFSSTTCPTNYVTYRTVSQARGQKSKDLQRGDPMKKWKINVVRFDSNFAQLYKMQFYAHSQNYSKIYYWKFFNMHQ